jgi:hypothetical protein
MRIRIFTFISLSTQVDPDCFKRKDFDIVPYIWEGGWEACKVKV